ncbi:unnamed protein product, partial [Mesorhabditis spiculigera]
MKEGISLFHYSLKRDVSGEFEADEEITCVGGCASEVFLGTSIGRVLHYQLVKKQNEDALKILGAIQLPSRKPVVSIDYASALEILLVISNQILFEISLETREIVSKKSDTIALTINTNPTSDDPFALQFATSTTNKKILVLEKKNGQNHNIQRLNCPGHVLALAYNKYTICYSSGAEYFVYDNISRRAINLFPFEPTVLTRPLVANVDQCEFLIAGMEGLCIFASATGVSTRPPFPIPTPPIRNFMQFQEYLFVCTEGKIYILSTNSLRVEQVIEIQGVAHLTNLDGCLWACTGSETFSIELISWETQVDELLTNGKYEDALRFAEAHLKSSYSEENIVKLNHLYQKIGFHYFFEGNFDGADELFRLGELDPSELVQLCPKLLVEFMPTQLHEQSSIDSVKNADAETVQTFIREYLEWTLENINKTSEQEMYIKTALLEFAILDGNAEITAFPQLDLPRLEEFLERYEKAALGAIVKFHLGKQEKALELWQKLAEDNLKDADFAVETVFEYLPMIEKQQNFLSALTWLCKIAPDRTKEFLEKYHGKHDSEKVAEILEPHSDLYLWFLENERRLGSRKWDTKLALFYLKSNPTDETNDIKKKLRELLLTSDSLYKDDILLASKNRKGLAADPVTAVPKLLKEQEILLAEEVCSRFGQGNPKLGTIMLSEYLTNPRIKTSEETLIRLVNGMAGYADPQEVLRNLPSTIKVKEISSFVRSALSLSGSKQKMLELAKSFADHGAEPILEKPDAKPIYVDEDSNCPVCNRGLFLAQKLKAIPSGYVVHFDCMPYPHLCPVTNQIFPELVRDRHTL